MKSVSQQLVHIGGLKIGGNHAISIQSMTSTSTTDTLATAEQVIRIVQAGAQLVRITARDEKEANHLAQIKEYLKTKSYDVPLIADIHFNRKAANVAAGIVDKVRINPGNYLAKRGNKTSWTNEEYQQELLLIKERLQELVNICLLHKTAIRVGVNYGSMSERIVNKYGNTAVGMAESAREFIEIFESLGFHQLVISLKASNVMVMVEANRILMHKMKAAGRIYPLHLGVTEAGDGDAGRIKSAIGIGSLLAQGIGHTIRVSLTEEPEFEIPVAREIIVAAQKSKYIYSQHSHQAFGRRNSYALGKIGHSQTVVVVSSNRDTQKKQLAADFVFNRKRNQLESSRDRSVISHLSVDDLLNDQFQAGQNYFVPILPEDWSASLGKKISGIKNMLIVLVKNPETSIGEVHHLLGKIDAFNIQSPLLLKIRSLEKDNKKLMIHVSVQAGPFLLAGSLDGLWIETDKNTTDLAFGMLQASRQRMSKTEYIACPSCGRTLFNIQEKLQEIKKVSGEFAGLKIAVMGCIVNGIGEMADADFGYVGAGPAKVNLYKGSKLIKKNVPEGKATKELLKVIQSFM